MIDVDEEKSIFETLLPRLKGMVDDRGIITLHEVNVIECFCLKIYHLA
jgi:hypothetical protein